MDLVHGDVEVLAGEAYVAALSCLGAIGVAEDPLVGLPVAVAVAGRGLVGTPLRAGGEVLLIGAQIGIRIAIDGRAYGGKAGRRI